MADKFEREIDEIIRKTGGDLPPPPRPTRRSVRRSPQPERRGGFSINPRQLLLAGIGLLLVGSLLISAVGNWGVMMAFAGIGLLVVAYIAFFNSKGSTAPGGYERRWRGQTVYEAGPSMPLSDRLRALWARLRR